MIWATVSSQSCFCSLYRASPSSAAKNIINLIGIKHLMMSMYRVVSCVTGRGCLLWPVHSLGKTLLAFALFHSVLPMPNLSFAPGIVWLLAKYFCIPVPYDENTFVCVCVLVLESLVGLHRTIQLHLIQVSWLGLLWYWMVCLGNKLRSFLRLHSSTAFWTLCCLQGLFPFF